MESFITRFKRDFNKLSLPKKTAFVATILTSAFVPAAMINEKLQRYAIDSVYSDIFCALDPTCRSLNDTEVALLWDYFGDQIDYDLVKTFSRGNLFYNDNDKAIAYVSGNNIYRGPQYHLVANDPQKANSIFVHEATHVWQHQNPSISGQDRGDNRNGLYSYNINEFESFADFGIEQQAEIMRALYKYQSSFSKELETLYQNISDPTEAIIAQQWVSDQCQKLKAHLDKARQVLPVAPISIPACEFVQS